jgi:hypothetical protein
MGRGNTAASVPAVGGMLPGDEPVDFIQGVEVVRCFSRNERSSFRVSSSCPYKIFLRMNYPEKSIWTQIKSDKRG